MGRGRTRRKFGFISKDDFIQNFSFLESWENQDVEELYEALKLRTRSKERFNRVSQQEIDKFKRRNSILAVLDNDEVRGFVLSSRISLFDRFDQESVISIKSLLKKKMLKSCLFTRSFIQKAF